RRHVELPGDRSRDEGLATLGEECELAFQRSFKICCSLLVSLPCSNDFSLFLLPRERNLQISHHPRREIICKATSTRNTRFYLLAHLRRRSRKSDVFRENSPSAYL